MSLSERVRPGAEAAPWVVDEICRMEQAQRVLLGRLQGMESVAEMWEAVAASHAAQVEAMRVLLGAAHADARAEELNAPVRSALSVVGLLTAAGDLVGQVERCQRDGFVEGPPGAASFGVTEGAWIELLDCARALAAKIASSKNMSRGIDD